MGGLPDAYVKIHLSQGQKEMKTKTIKSSANPVWNEDFRFQVDCLSSTLNSQSVIVKIPISETTQKTLTLQVMDYDRLSKNDLIGEVKIPLWQVDFSQINEGWKNIAKATGKVEQL